jgi:hypothetical protein
MRLHSFMIFIYFRFFDQNSDDYVFRLEYWKLVFLRNLNEHLREITSTKAEEYVCRKLYNSWMISRLSQN